MIRKSLLILSIVGLVLSVGLWIVSYFHVYYFSGQSIVSAELGAIIFQQMPGGGTIHVRDSRGFMYVREQLTWVGYSGLSTLSVPVYSLSPLVVICPLWIPAVLCAFAIWFNGRYARQSRRRKREGLCMRCGYDLRSSTDMCPECGHEAPHDAQGA